MLQPATAFGIIMHNENVMLIGVFMIDGSFGFYYFGEISCHLLAVIVTAATHGHLVFYTCGIKTEYILGTHFDGRIEQDIVIWRVKRKWVVANIIQAG